MKQAFTRFAFILCAAIAGFATGRFFTDCRVTVPAHQAAQFYLSADMKELTVLHDTTNIAAVNGLTGPYEHHVYKLDSIAFNAFYFRSGWTAFVRTGGHFPDTTLFIQYQGRAVCVSPAVDHLIIAKYMHK